MFIVLNNYGNVYQNNLRDFILPQAVWLTSTKPPTTKAGEGARKQEPSAIAGGSANWCSQAGKSVEKSQKAKNKSPV